MISWGVLYSRGEDVPFPDVIPRILVPPLHSCVNGLLLDDSAVLDCVGLDP